MANSGNPVNTKVTSQSAARTPSDDGHSATFRRRRLPLPPTPQPLLSISLPAPPASDPAPASVSQSAPYLHPRSDRLSRKITPRFLQRQATTTFETTDDNGAGPSGSNQADWSDNNGALPSPSTEYPDQFEGLPLPSYYDNAETDPNAAASLGYGPRINTDDYTGPPPSDSFDEPVESPSQSFAESEPLADGSFISQ
jgi:hypothetical protein